MNLDMTYCSGLRCVIANTCERWIPNLEKQMKEKNMDFKDQRISIANFSDHEGHCDGMYIPVDKEKSGKWESTAKNMRLKKFTKLLTTYVSKCGVVISVNRKKPYVLKPALTRRGYFRVWLSKGKNHFVHTLVMKHWVGPCESGMQVNHKNGIKTDNRLENLEYCTLNENAKHAADTRLYLSGSKHYLEKLNERDVVVIRKASKTGMSQEQLARAFNVNSKAIRLILKRETWKYAEVDLQRKSK